jgi:virginiamycin A acetyltransferase
MVRLGRHSYLGNIQERFNPNVTVGNFTSIAGGVVFYGDGCEHPTAMNRNVVSSFPFKELWNVDYQPCGSRGQITIGSDVWIGEDARIMDGVTIGDGCIVGTFSVVGKDLPPYAVYAGNRIVRFRYDQETINKLLKLKWWDKTDDEIKQMFPVMNDITKFIEAYA